MQLNNGPPMNNLDWQIRNHILTASYFENYAYAKELYRIKSDKAPKQWLESRKHLKELINHKKLKVCGT